MIYLDNAATTEMCEEAIESMIDCMKNIYGNPSSVHSVGVDAKNALYDARKKVSKYLGGCSEESIIFTSGGTEGNNLVLKGFLSNGGKVFNHIAVSAAEHESVYESVSPFKRTIIPVNIYGEVDLDILERMFKNTYTSKSDRIELVSIMYCNNEVGSVNNIKDAAKICHDNGALIHTDMVQAGGYDIDVVDLGVDFATISSHKIHGPKGVGAVYVKDKSTLSPIITGGKYHEFGLRSGTENVPGIVGFGSACIHTLENDDVRVIDGLKRLFYASLVEELNGEVECRLNGRNDNHLSKIASVTLNGIDAQTLVMMMDMEGVCISAGSACNSNETKPSRVLTSMGFGQFEARNTVRVSFSMMNSGGEVMDAAKAMADCAIRLYKLQ